MIESFAIPRIRSNNCAKMHLLGVAALAAFVSTFVIPAFSQTNSPAACNELVQQIESYAVQDADSGASPKDELVISLFRDKKVGCTPNDISQIYRRRYFSRFRGKESWYDRVPHWLYPVLLVLALFWRPLKNVIEERLKKVLRRALHPLCWSQALRGRALARYRRSVLKQHENFKIPFRDAPLKMREVYVPVRVSEAGSPTPIDAMEAVRSHRHLMVKGVPGSGKSMLLRSLLLAYADGRLGIEGDPVPVLVELSRLNDPGTNLQKTWSPHSSAVASRGPTLMSRELSDKTGSNYGWMVWTK